MLFRSLVPDEATGAMAAVNVTTGQRTDPAAIQRALFNGLSNIGADPKDYGIMPPEAPKAAGTTKGSVGLPAKENAPTAQPTAQPTEQPAKQPVQNLKGMDITEMNPNQLREAAYQGIIPGASTTGFDVQQNQNLANSYAAKARIAASNGVSKEDNVYLKQYESLQAQIDKIGRAHV